MKITNSERLQLSAACLGRPLFSEVIACDLVICGGGLAGVCAAITAARSGLKVTLIQDRPVLGGNASSEVRLWALGATSHMGNNNRWAREGGLVDEILTENLFRNPEGNPLMFDALLLEKVSEEANIRLLLNTSVHAATKDTDTPNRIAAVEAFCSQNSTLYKVTASLFVDASGDGILGFLSGGAFRMGAESVAEFGEGFAPTEEYGYLLGHSIYFMSKDVGRPVRYTPPSFAIKEVEKLIPRYRDFDINHQACQFWWIEYGGRLDTVQQSEAIKWELWRVVYGVWDYIKNSGKFPEAENLTLEWVGHVPGKRESRRFEGDYMLVQQDIVEQRRHADAVSFGGWALDLHPADGVFASQGGCDQWHSKGVYQIPYRTLYSRNIENLFLAGRVISASHVAFGSSRVMLTCAHNAVAVGAAAALCTAHQCRPRELLDNGLIPDLQQTLIRTGHYIPHVALKDDDDLVSQAKLEASSEYAWDGFAANGPDLALDQSRALLFPAPAGRLPRFTVEIAAEKNVELLVELRVSEREGNFTPDQTLDSKTFSLQATGGQYQSLEIEFEKALEKPQYCFVCFMQAEGVKLRGSDERVSGILTVGNAVNKSVAKSAAQEPDPSLGIDSFEFWIPQRRPAGHNIAIRFADALPIFGVDQLRSGYERPVFQSNAWVANPSDENATLTLKWDEPQSVAAITLALDSDYDHPMETVIQNHPERQMPFCVSDIRIEDGSGKEIFHTNDNHQSYLYIRLKQPVNTSQLRITLKKPATGIPAALFGVRCYANGDMQKKLTRQ
jgi:hypothetical protein